MKTSQLYEGEWSPVKNKWFHECCECGLVHRVKYKIENGVLYEMWNVHRAETRQARKRRKG